MVVILVTLLMMRIKMTVLLMMILTTVQAVSGDGVCTDGPGVAVHPREPMRLHRGQHGQQHHRLCPQAERFHHGLAR